MKLAGWQGTTLIDYPGRVASTVFAVGCNFRCPFCHNPELVLPERSSGLALLDPDELLARLDRRRGFLDGVVLTGGEPTLQEGLSAFVGRLKRSGYRVKLDTNGSRPQVVRSLLREGLLDFVAVDVKAPPERYAEFTGRPSQPSDVATSVEIVKASGVEYELRTTVAPGLTADDIRAIARWVGPAARYVLQAFRAPQDKRAGLVDPSWASRETLGERELHVAWECVRDRFADGGVRA